MQGCRPSTFTKRASHNICFFLLEANSMMHIECLPCHFVMFNSSILVVSLRHIYLLLHHCALFSLLLPCGGLEKFCCRCFVVSFEVLRTCSFYIVSLRIETNDVVLVHGLSSLA